MFKVPLDEMPQMQREVNRLVDEIKELVDGADRNLTPGARYWAVRSALAGSIVGYINEQAPSPEARDLELLDIVHLLSNRPLIGATD